MQSIQQHLSLLGLPAKDRVTGMEGVITSVCFDLYGCVMATLNPGLSADKKIQDSHWFDVKRLTVTGAAVMEAPNFAATPAGQETGPAEKSPMASFRA